MTTSLSEPDLAVSLQLDPYAPRAARHHVAQVDRPSPDLRDAVMLLTSELVTRAVHHSENVSGEAVELRVWMPSDVVRVELRGACELLSSAAEKGDGPDYELLLLENVADRWSVDSGERDACMWFEIDRHTVREAVPAGV
ncbi:MAG: hypothetical protein ACYDHN_04620 [Solirubrobacteraceae bacterium]